MKTPTPLICKKHSRILIGKSKCVDCEKEQLQKENKRLRAALDWIALVANKNNPHLGRPRSSDKTCIFCMAYLALNEGAYGEYIDYEKLAKDERITWDLDK